VIDDAGHPLGVVTKTDMLVHAKQHPAVDDDSATVADVMTPAVFSVREDATAASVVEQMLALNVHHLFVVDDAGVVVGIISPLDIVRQLA
jgi:predicted transcriptional regulator